MKLPVDTEAPLALAVVSCCASAAFVNSVVGPALQLLLSFIADWTKLLRLCSHVLH